MRVPSLPGGFLDVLSYFDNGGAAGSNLAGVPIPGYDGTGTGTATAPGSGQQTPQFPRMERSGSGFQSADFSAFSRGMQGRGSFGNGTGTGAQGRSGLDGLLSGASVDVGAGGRGGSGADASGVNGNAGTLQSTNPPFMSGQTTGGTMVPPLSTDMTRSTSGGRGSGQGQGKGKNKEVFPLGNLSRM